MWAITLLATSSGMYQHWGRYIRCVDQRVGESTEGQVYQRGGGRCINTGAGVSTGGRASVGRINGRLGVSTGGWAYQRAVGRINRRQMYTGGMGVSIAGQHVGARGDSRAWAGGRSTTCPCFRQRLTTPFTPLSLCPEPGL